MEALTTVEVALLAEMLRSGAKGKVSSKCTLEWGAGSAYSGSGLAIPSKGGKLSLGAAKQPAKALTIEAAPGSSENKLFTLRFDVGSLRGVVMRDTVPVVWRIQKGIPVKVGSDPAVWTHGMDTKKITETFEQRGGAALLCVDHTGYPQQVRWVIGFDKDDKPAIAMFGDDRIERFKAIDGVAIAAPDAAQLAATRAEASPHALPAAEVAALAAAIQREGTRKLATPKGYWIKEWREAKPSNGTSLRIAGNTFRIVPSVKGVVMLGNPVTPKAAVKLALGGGENRYLLLSLWINGRPLSVPGLRLSDELAVRWEIAGELSSGPAHDPSDPKSACIAFWSPGAEKTAKAITEPLRAHSHATERGIAVCRVDANVGLHWIVGYDAKNKPAVVIVGELAAVQAFDNARAALADPTGAAKQVARARKALAAEIAGPKLPAASKLELTSIASAIASGKQTKINARFSLAWQKVAIPAVEGELEVGDPGGDSFRITAGDGAKQVFELFDGENKPDKEHGRRLYGVRLGAGKVTTWKRAKRIGVDSGRYGVWSPSFELADVDEGTHKTKTLAATIIATAEGDCAFGSLLGLDAKKQPVAFLFGEALHDEVFLA